MRKSESDRLDRYALYTLIAISFINCVIFPLHREFMWVSVSRIHKHSRAQDSCRPLRSLPGCHSAISRVLSKVSEHFQIDTWHRALSCHLLLSHVGTAVLLCGNIGEILQGQSSFRGFNMASEMWQRTVLLENTSTRSWLAVFNSLQESGRLLLWPVQKNIFGILLLLHPHFERLWLVSEGRNGRSKGNDLVFRQMMTIILWLTIWKSIWISWILQNRFTWDTGWSLFLRTDTMRVVQDTSFRMQQSDCSLSIFMTMRMPVRTTGPKIGESEGVWRPWTSCQKTRGMSTAWTDSTRSTRERSSEFIPGTITTHSRCLNAVSLFTNIVAERDFDLWKIHFSPSHFTTKHDDFGRFALPENRTTEL